MSKDKGGNDFEMQKKGVAPLLSPACGTVTLGHAENAKVRKVPQTEIYLLLTLMDISLASVFLLFDQF